MSKFIRNWSLAITLLVAMTTPLVASLGLGLDVSYNVFVQEYWRDGRPYYLIANLREKPVAILACGWDPDLGDGETLGEWCVDEGSYRLVNVKGLPKQDYVAFYIDDDPWGVMRAPELPGEIPGIVSYVGLNGVGGRDFGVGFHLRSMEVRRGERFAVTLRIKSGAGILHLHKRVPLNKHGRPSRQFSIPVYGQPNKWFTLPVAHLLSAKSATLPIRDLVGQVIVEAIETVGATKAHEVQLEYLIPDNADGPLVVISGWIETEPGLGRTIVKGIAMEAR